jgi:hypothetical protein
MSERKREKIHYSTDGTDGRLFRIEPARSQQKLSLNNQPCYFAAQEGITTCKNCRGKLVCDKSPERKL